MTAGEMATRGGGGWQPKPLLPQGRTQSKLQNPQKKDTLRGAREGGDEHPNRTDSRTTTQDKGITTTTIRCICGRICKNEHGLKIHQGRMRCLTAETTTQRTEATSVKTQEEPGPEATHSAQSLLVSPTPAASSSPATITQETAFLDNPQGLQSQQAAAITTGCAPSVKPRIQWPKSSKRVEWQQFDEDVSQVLEVTAKGDVDHRLRTMTTLIVNIAAERFGTEVAKPAPSAYAPSHRARKITCLREELRLLKRQYKSAGEVERAGLADLRAILRKQLFTLRRAEFHRRRRKERARKRAAFLANPFKLTKQLLGQKRAGRLTCCKDAINDHLKATYSDSIREQPLGPCDALITPPEPASDFDLKEPRLREVEEVVRRARSSSKWSTLQGV